MQVLVAQYCKPHLLEKNLAELLCTATEWILKEGMKTFHMHVTIMP